MLAGATVRAASAKMVARPSGLTVKPQSGSAMYLSTSAVSRLSQSKGVRAGSKGALKALSSLTAAGSDSEAASMSSADEPESTSPSMSALRSSAKYCAANEPIE